MKWGGRGCAGKMRWRARACERACVRGAGVCVCVCGKRVGGGAEGWERKRARARERACVRGPRGACVCVGGGAEGWERKRARCACEDAPPSSPRRAAE